MAIKVSSILVVVFWYTTFYLLLTSANMNWSIDRGTTDVFTNPSHVNVQSNNSTFSNCKKFAAHCVTSDCLKCRCNADHPTFYKYRSLKGKCVKDEKLSIYLDDSYSFLVSRQCCGSCMEPFSANTYLTLSTCDVHNMKQHWIWTKHNQLLNLHTLTCVQTSSVPIFKFNERRFPKVSLTACNASDIKQKWSCSAENSLLFYLDYAGAYLNYGNVYTYVILFSGKGNYSMWKRYGAVDKSLCSKVSSYHAKQIQSVMGIELSIGTNSSICGCYRYSDGSSMFTIKPEDWKICKAFPQNCETEKDIAAPIEATNQYCSIKWKISKFLNHSNWADLPESLLDEKPFRLVDTNSIHKKITLKVNLAKSQYLRGQIIKLYINCANQQDDEETHCVLVKFSGDVLASPFIQISKTSGPSSSTTVMIIVLSVTGSLLLIAAVVIFIVIKKKRSRTVRTHETRNDFYDSAISAQSPGIRHAETVNPYYTPSTPNDYDSPLDGRRSHKYEVVIVPNSASRECKLYEPSNIGYCEPDVIVNTNSVLGYTYDYAKPDGMDVLPGNPLYVGRKTLQLQNTNYRV